MAISNDSFGSPGLGEGIGLQGTLKDYTPLIAKSRLAEQAMISKAAQKKLEQDLQDQEKLDKELARLNATAGIPAFTPRYKEEGLKVIKVIEKLKNENKPILTNPEFLKAKFEFQQNMDKIRFEEDEIKRQITGFGKDPNNEEYDYDYFNALWDETGKSLSAINPEGKPNIVSGRQFIKKLPKYNYESDWKAAVRKVTPVEGKGYFETTTAQGTPVLQYDETSKYKQEDIDRTWNEFKLQGSVRDRIKKDAESSGLTEKQIEDELYKQFDALFKDKVKQTASTIRTDNQYGPGGTQPGKDINISYTDNAGDQTSFIRPIAEGLAEKRIKEEFDKYKKGETLDFFESIGLGKDDESRKSVTYDKFKLKIDKYNSTQSDEAMKIGDVDRIIGILSRTDQLSKYNNRPGINVVRTNAPQNKDFKGVKDSKGKEMEAAFMSYIPADNAKKLPAVFLVLRNDGGGNYTVTEVPASDYNKSVYATEFRIDPKAENNNFDYWFGKKKSDYESGRGGTSIGKAYGDGGLVEPKTVSQKFHNKSKNMTKFVYSDGSEEIFNGIL